MKLPKSHNTVGSSTYESIKRDIIFGRLEPGKKLKLEALKATYEASVSTLRETLNRLASEGFVEAAEQRGFFVTPVSREDLIEVANLRSLLECHALTTSIETGDTDWEANLVAAYHRLHVTEQRLLSGDQSDKELWKRYDQEFHLAMIQACNSQNLLRLHSIIFDKYLRYQMLVLTSRGSVAVAEHKEMYDAALSRRVGDACSSLHSHIIRGLEHALKEM